MTLLELLQEFCTRRGLPVPALVLASHDDQLLQLKSLCNELLEDLGTRRIWTRMQKEAVWNSLAAEDQGTVESIAPGCQWISNGTIWNRTRRLPFVGPKSAKEWQAIKAMNFQGVQNQYRIWQGHLYITPAPAAGQQMAFEYTSPYLVLAADGTTYKSRFTSDTDTCLLPDAIILAGLNWKWKYEKGFKYAEEFRAYESIVADFAGHDGTKKPLRMDSDGDGTFGPAVVIPNGNWSLP